MGWGARLNSLVSLAKSQWDEPLPTATEHKLPTEIRLQIAQQVTVDALSDAQRQSRSREHAETVAAKAMGGLALQGRDWARCAFTAEQDRPGVGFAMTRNAIARLGQRSAGDIELFRKDIHYALHQRQHVEVPFHRLTEEQQQVVFQALLAKPPSKALRLIGFTPHNAAYIPMIAQRAAPSSKISVDLANRNLSDEDLEHLGPLFEQPHAAMQAIDLRWNRFSQTRLDALPSAYRATDVLHEWNQMSPQATAVVQSILGQASDNAILDLSGIQGLLEADLMAIADALQKNAGRHTAMYLNHGFDAGNHVGRAGTEALAMMLGHEDCRMVKLGLVNGGVDDQGASALAQVLGREHCSLTHLNLRGNQITPAGGIALANGIDTSNGKFKSLSLRGNPLDAASRAILEAAANRKGVKLDLG